MPRSSSSSFDILEGDDGYNPRRHSVSHREIRTLLSTAGTDRPDLEGLKESTEQYRTRQRAAKKAPKQSPEKSPEESFRKSSVQPSTRFLRRQARAENKAQAPEREEDFPSKSKSYPQSLLDACVDWYREKEERAKRLKSIARGLKLEKAKGPSEASVQKLDTLRADLQKLQRSPVPRSCKGLPGKKKILKIARKELAERKRAGRLHQKKLKAAESDSTTTSGNASKSTTSDTTPVKPAGIVIQDQIAPSQQPEVSVCEIKTAFSQGDTDVISQGFSDLSNTNSESNHSQDTPMAIEEIENSFVSDHVIQDKNMPQDQAMKKPESYPLTDECHHYTHLSEVPWDIQKYWHQRHSIFSAYDYGIYMTDDAWFGVTPEPVAGKVAFDLGANTVPSKTVIIDIFAGAGGNAIAFALSGRWTSIIAIEKNSSVIACAQNNAAIYGVSEKITWINDDCFAYLSKADIDLSTTVVFASPPWGGPGYSTDEIFDLSTMQPYSVKQIHELCKGMDCALYLPRTSDLRQIAKLAPKEGDGKIEVVQYCMEGASKALVAYIPADTTSTT